MASKLQDLASSYLLWQAKKRNSKKKGLEAKIRPENPFVKDFSEKFLPYLWK